MYTTLKRCIYANVMNQGNYLKAYTRDTSLIIQEAWLYACVDGLEQKLGITNPFPLSTIYYMRDGALELWFEENFVDWLSNALRARYLSHPQEVVEILNKYEEGVKELKEHFWSHGPITDKGELVSFIDHVNKLMVGYMLMYFYSLAGDFPKELQEYVNALRKEDVFFDANDKLIRVSLQAIFPEYKNYVTCFLQKEVATSPASLNTYKERFEHLVLWSSDGFVVKTLKEYLAENPGLHFIFDDQGVAKDTSTVSGEVAYPGIIRGKVRLVYRKDQVALVKDGEIIVSPMTTPDYVPAMKKAAGFVTDEGGLLCHAAIIARELKKPCIIGTKVATTVFKDGDMVEVDATKGTVSKI